jgi:hypothetical protein
MKMDDSVDLTVYLFTKASPMRLADDGVSFKPYLGAPILFYAKYDLDISAVPCFVYVDSDGTTERVVDDLLVCQCVKLYNAWNLLTLYLLWCGH